MIQIAESPPSDDEKEIDQQVLRFHREIVELVKKYQFRDRNEIICCGISVSQCYILEALHRNGPMTMNLLAEKMHLSVSTLTRVVEHLVKKQLVRREKKPSDRRFHSIGLTEKGEWLYQSSWQNIFDSEKIIMKHFPADRRELLIDLLAKLNRAFGHWKNCCTRKK